MTSKSHITLWCMFANHYGSNPKTIAFAKINSASKGTYFHTIQMPALGRAFDLALETGYIDIVDTEFTYYSKSSMLPRFMSEFFIKVFTRDGYLRDDACPVVIKSIRQLLYLHYKFITPFSKEQMATAQQKFIETDLSVKTDFSEPMIDAIRNDFVSLLPDNPYDIRCGHSNGATKDKFNNSDRRHVKRPLPLVKELTLFFFNSVHHAKACKLNIRNTDPIPQSRFVVVPKDSRGPRGISIEPHEHMFVQQGLMWKLYDHIENDSPAKGFINFTDQGVNNDLAYRGSMDQQYSTIDLKDASDMVSWALVQKLLPPDWLRVVTMCRSSSTVVGEKVHTLAKFAPMGSALCFPIEAMLFWSIVRTVTDRVWVYGDDIIVERRFFHAAIAALESYGLVVNALKSLHNGFFRESCGGEYYRGYDISYIKCKSYDKVEFIAFCNLVADGVAHLLADNMVKYLEEQDNFVVYRLPLHRKKEPEALVFYTDNCASNSVFFRTRYNRDLQHYEVRRLRAYTLYHQSELDLSDVDVDYDNFYLWLLSKQSSSPLEDAYIKNVTSGVQLTDMYRISKKTYTVSFDDAVSATGVAKPGIKYAWGPQGLAH